MTTTSQIGICEICEEVGIKVDERGFCFELDKWGHVVAGCLPVAQHIRHEMKKRGHARLRTKIRTPQEAERIMETVGLRYGFGVRFERGDTWVKGYPTKDVPENLRVPRTRTKDGFIVEELDYPSLVMEFTVQKQRIALMEQMVALDPGSVQNLVQERHVLDVLERQMKAVEDERKSA